MGHRARNVLTAVVAAVPLVVLVVIGLGLHRAATAADPALPLLPSSSPSSSPTLPCDAPDSLFIDSSPLPVAASALKSRHALKILAIGSLSTQGVGSSPATAWPGRLGAALRLRYPDMKIEVANRGRPRVAAADMLANLAADAREERPDVVIWESGTMDAVRNTNVDNYRQALMDGVDLLAQQHIDTVLMDTQFSRAANAVVDVRPYVDAAQQVGEMRDLVVFPRYGLMQYWMDNGRLSFDDIKRPIQIKLADQIYDCIGRQLAKMVIEAVERTP